MLVGSALIRGSYHLYQGWGGFAGYDAWVRQANNASLGAQAAYDQWVPAFETLLEAQGRNFARFYDAVRALAEQPKAERSATLTGGNRSRKTAPIAFGVLPIW